MRTTRIIRNLAALAGTLCLPQAAAQAGQSLLTPVQTQAQIGSSQSGSSLIQAATSQTPPALPAIAPHQSVPHAQGRVRLAPQSPARTIVLERVIVEGAHAIAPSAIRALWQAKRGHTLGQDGINQIADALGALYQHAGLALYTVSVPAQSFAGGTIRLRVVEGYVASVAITGDTGGDMSLLRRYAAAIVADRPLHQATLERQILLMGAIPGLKIGSRLEAIPNTQGGTRLVLVVKRKRLDAGIGVNNQGFPLLGRSQLEANVVVNSLFQQGDRTQLTIGLPPERFETYQYAGLSEQQPLGHNGATIAATIGALHTKTDGLGIDGHAIFGDLQASLPLVRRLHQSLTVSLALDALDSNNALLGQALTDERTRAIRAAAAYAFDDSLAGALPATTSASAVLSQGIDALGARRGTPQSGGPAFTKLAIRLERDQTLPANLVLRLKAAGQLAGQALPASEQFTYGGSEFGRAFLYDAVQGDSGLAGAAELAWRVPRHLTTATFAGSELFGFVDAGAIHNHTPAQGELADHGSSGGFGVRFEVLGKSVIQLEVAVPIQAPLLPAEEGADGGTRLLFNVSSAL